MTTCFLDLETWDLTLDDKGDILLASNKYEIAQNVANAIRLFFKDAYFNQDSGIPHFNLELGENPQEETLRAAIYQAAVGVDGVADVTIEFIEFVNRVLKGVVTITTVEGEIFNVNI